VAKASPPGLKPVIRDSILLAGGVLGVGFQQVTGNVNPILIGVYLTMLGVPALSNGTWLLKLLLKENSESSSSSSPELPSSTGSAPQSEVSSGDA
jgi:hypothetical protein